MRNYHININGNDVPGECIINEDNNYVMGDNSNHFEYKFISENIISLRVNNKNYMIKAEADADNDISNTLFNLELFGNSYKVSCKSELDKLVEEFSKNKRGNKIKNEIISPMPGSIVKINVKEGQIVNKGDVLLVLEAMKMENEIKVTADCKVVRIFVDEKKSVEKGQLLMKLDSIDK